MPCVPEGATGPIQDSNYTKCEQVAPSRGLCFVLFDQILLIKQRPVPLRNECKISAQKLNGRLIYLFIVYLTTFFSDSDYTNERMISR
jgi:hypothetical protein